MRSSRLTDRGELRARAKISCAFLVTQRFRCEAQIRRQLISFQEFATKQMKMMC